MDMIKTRLQALSPNPSGALPLGPAGGYTFTPQVDMIKSRVQVDGMSGPRLYRSSYHCYTTVLSEGGATGLYRGTNSGIARTYLF